MSTEFDYYKTGDDGSAGIVLAAWVAQTFTASNSYSISSVKLLLYRLSAGGPGTVTVTINTTSGGLPTSTILCTGTTNGDTLTTNNAGEWREIIFTSSANLTSGVVYAIVVSAPAGSYNLRWRDDSSSPTYSGGKACSSSNSGSSWAAISPDQDQMFDTYGIILPPTITSQSGDQVVTEGDQVTLSITATGNPTYQWYKGGVVVSNATSSTYQFYTGFDSAGSYTCTATNAGGSATTDPAILVTITSDSHWKSPTSYSDPSSAWTNPTNSIDQNTSTYASSTVNSLTWSGLLYLTWDDKYTVSKVAFNVLQNINNLANCKVELYYDGVWNDVYDLTTHTNNGWWTVILPTPKRIYQARVSFYDSYGGGGSHTAKVYEFRYYGYEIPVITAQSSGATFEYNDPVSLSVTAEGEPTLTYQWYKNSGILVGETNPTLNFNAGVTSGGNYTCTVTNSYGSATTTAIVIVVNVYAPTITDQSSGTSCFTGFEIDLFVVAAGSPPPTYQWYKNSVLIDGATNSTYIFFAGPASDDVYICTVTNVLGSDTTDPIIIHDAGPDPSVSNLFDIPLDLSFEG